MPIIAPATGFGRMYQTTAKAGVGLTSGGSAHTMGNWATLIDPLSYDCFGVFVNVNGVAGAAADSSGLMDLGVGPTGGGSEDVVVPFIDVGAAFTASGACGKTYFFPLYIPKGKALRARWQSITASDTTISVLAYGFQLPLHGSAEDAPQQWVQYGADSANSRGTAVTTGSGTFGTEVQVTASTSRLHRWFHVGLSWGTNTNISTGRYRVRLARDTGAAEVIGQWDFAAPTGNEEIVGPMCCFPVSYLLPAGSSLYIDVDGAAAEAATVTAYAA